MRETAELENVGSEISRVIMKALDRRGFYNGHTMISTPDGSWLPVRTIVEVAESPLKVPAAMLIGVIRVLDLMTDLNEILDLKHSSGHSIAMAPNPNSYRSLPAEKNTKDVQTRLELDSF